MSSGYNSSNTFVRPQSSQTANTSIDAPLPKSSTKSGHERNYSDSTTDGREINHSTYFTAAEEDSTNTLGKLSHSFSNFSQSSQGTASGSRRADYIKETLPAPLEVDYSSDDSFLEKQMAGEERLLFDDLIYGDGAKGLPGLFDAFSGPSSPIAPNTPQSAIAKPSMRSNKSNKSTPKKSTRRHKLRHSHSTPFQYSNLNSGFVSSSEDEDDDSFFDPEFEYLREKAFAIPDIRIHGSSPGRVGMYGVAEDEEEHKIDTSTAARLRKELDRQKRRTMGHLPPSHGKGKSRARRQRDDDSDAADTEDWGPYR